MLRTSHPVNGILNVLLMIGMLLPFGCASPPSEETADSQPHVPAIADEASVTRLANSEVAIEVRNSEDESHSARAEEAEQAVPAQVTALEWGPALDAIQTRLLPAQARYVVGQPMTFRLEMMSLRSDVAQYDDQAVGVNRSMEVIGPDGEPVRYLAGGVQTVGGPEPIHPSEVVTLLESYDARTQFYIAQPGRYTIRFRRYGAAFGEIVIPESNTVVFDVEPGTLSAKERILARLVAIVPNDWELITGGHQPRSVHPRGREKTQGYGFFFRYKNAPVRNNPYWLSLHITKQPAAPLTLSRAPTRSHADTKAPLSKLVGKCAWGFVYMLSSKKAEEKWPGCREALAEALVVQQ